MGDEGIYDLSGHFMPAPGARRFEVGSVYRPGLKAMLANLVWLDETIGWEWIHNRIVHLATYACHKLEQLSGVTVITPPGPQAGLVTFNLDGYDPPRVMAKLAEENIVLRFIKHPYALRISTGFYNTEGDLDQLVAALQNILGSDPESLPPSEY
jgi:L-cysteine/cystine lyase